MYNKRGISPLIATVLIIGFTIVLAVLVIAWLSGVFEGELDTEQCSVEGQKFCAGLGGIGGLLDVTATQAAADAAVNISAVWAGDFADRPALRISVTNNETGDVMGIVNIATSDFLQATGVASGQLAATAGTAANAEIRALHTPVVAGVVCEEMTCTPIDITVEQTA